MDSRNVPDKPVLELFRFATPYRVVFKVSLYDLRVWIKGYEREAHRPFASEGYEFVFLSEANFNELKQELNRINATYRIVPVLDHRFEEDEWRRTNKIEAV
jgi:hypothetical protein